MLFVQLEKENFFLRQFWIEYTLILLPFFPDYESTTSKLLSCISHQFYLFRTSLSKKGNHHKNPPSDIHILIFATERILAYYLTKRKSRKGLVESKNSMINIGFTSDPSGGLVYDSYSWTEPHDGKTKDVEQSIFMITVSIVSDISLLSHFISIFESNNPDILKNIAAIKFRSQKVFDTCFKIDIDYICDGIMGAWDLMFENYNENLEVRNVINNFPRVTGVFANLFILFSPQIILNF